jgi:hypothetical protein
MRLKRPKKAADKAMSAWLAGPHALDDVLDPRLN